MKKTERWNLNKIFTTWKHEKNHQIIVSSLDVDDINYDKIFLYVLNINLLVNEKCWKVEDKFVIFRNKKEEDLSEERII